MTTRKQAESAAREIAELWPKEARDAAPELHKEIFLNLVADIIERAGGQDTLEKSWEMERDSSENLMKIAQAANERASGETAWVSVDQFWNAWTESAEGARIFRNASMKECRLRFAEAYAKRVALPSPPTAEARSQAEEGGQ